MQNIQFIFVQLKLGTEIEIDNIQYITDIDVFLVEQNNQASERILSYNNYTDIYIDTAYIHTYRCACVCVRACTSITLLSYVVCLCVCRCRRNRPNRDI